MPAHQQPLEGGCLLKIVNWNEHFENASSRKLKRLEWIAMPVKMSGAGYTELVTHEHGAEHFAAWIAIVEIAATQEPRGSLPKAVGRNSHDVGGICQSLGRISQLPIRIFLEAVPRLIDDLQWIESDVQSLADSASALGKSANVLAESAEHIEGNRREGNRREGNDTTGALTVRQVGDAFSEWIKPWPRCASPDMAARAWLSTVTGETLSLAFEARDRYLASDEVHRNVILEPSKWLFAQKDAGWNGKWPVALTQADRKGKPDVADQAKEIMRKRLENGRSPL